MAREEDAFKLRLGRRIANAGLRRVRPKIREASKTLARNASVRLTGFEAGGTVRYSIGIDHYWALFVHDGRNPFSKTRNMVWWRNPRLDPRLQGGVTPKRASQLRRLGERGWARAKAIRDEWIRQGNDPYESPVVITKTIRRRTKATPFFNNRGRGGMRGFVKDANRLGSAEFSQFVAKRLAADGILNVKETISIGV